MSDPSIWPQYQQYWFGEPFYQTFLFICGVGIIYRTEIMAA
ncbi:hypothetical protein [Mastigocoleus testarum]|nr:hypothetical protein [Mastigocoleus testarum]